MIDRELVTRKMNLIAPDLRKIRQLAERSLEEYLADSINEDLAERYLERVIGRMIDINFHILTESGVPPPPDYYDSFLRLADLSILPREFALSLASCAGLRNRIVHEYDAIDTVLVFRGLCRAAADLPAYLVHIQAFLDSRTRGAAEPL